MNKGKYYVLPDGAKVEKVKIEMFKTGNGFAYQEERSAEYNIAIGSICDCGEYIDGKVYTACSKCRDKSKRESYLKLELVEWDCETPLSIYRGDEYFFNTDELESYCDTYKLKSEELLLVLCEPVKASYFELNEHCIDEMPEGWTIDDYKTKGFKYSADEVENIVNEFLEKISPLSWVGGNKRVTVKGL